MKIKTAFITGVSGQDGSLLAELLLGKGYLVYGLMREKSSDDNLVNMFGNPNFHLIEGDSLNNDLIAFLIKTYKFNEIYNLASQSNIRLSYTDPVHTFNVTLMGTLILLENIKKYSPQSKMFQAGSSAMFGESCDEETGVQNETTPMKPISPYASSKLFSHNICCNYRDNEQLFVCNGILYNHESNKSKTLLGVTKVFIDRARNNERIFIDNVNTVIDLGHAKDYVEAMWLIMQQIKADDYVIASHFGIPLYDLAKKIIDKFEFEVHPEVTPLSNKPTFKAIGDSTKLKKIGWKPKYDIDKLIEDLIYNS